MLPAMLAFVLVAHSLVVVSPVMPSVTVVVVVIEMPLVRPIVPVVMMELRLRNEDRRRYYDNAVGYGYAGAERKRQRCES